MRQLFHRPSDPVHYTNFLVLFPVLININGIIHTKTFQVLNLKKDSFHKSYRNHCFLIPIVKILGKTLKNRKNLTNVIEEKVNDEWKFINTLTPFFRNLQFLGVGFYVWPAQLCSDNKIKMILKALSLLCRKLSWHKKKNYFAQDLWFMKYTLIEIILRIPTS